MNETYSDRTDPPGKNRALLYGMTTVIAMLLGIGSAIRDAVNLKSQALARDGIGIDARYAVLRSRMPTRPSVVGYVNDSDLIGSRASASAAAAHYYQAQYALAPHLLQREPSTATLIIIDLENRDLLPMLAAQFRLEVTHDCDGTWLARRRKGDAE
jgi:hypothetical protein